MRNILRRNVRQSLTGLLGIAQHIAERYHLACKKPMQHKALIGGHILIVTSFALGLLDMGLAANATGLTSSLMMLLHTWTREL